MLFSDTVEALKTQYTDKYVKVDATRPELARFRDTVGQVKTVNMNGRALVEFADYHLNTGWYDIALSCLTVVDKPAPKAATEKHAEPKAAAAKPQAAKAATPAGGEKKLSPLEMARMQGAGKGAAAAPAKPAGDAAAPVKKSTADILAAARGGAGGAPAAPAKLASGGGKPSTADILAAARGGKPAAATPADASAPVAPKAAAPAPAAEPASAAPAASAGGVVKIDWKSMSTADKIAYCRAKDGK